MNLLPPWGKPHLVLHVGPHKTGSTAIQEFCVGHRAELADAGYWYPFESRWDIQHAALPAAYLQEHPFIPSELLDRDPAEVIDRIRAEIPPGFRLILSSEVFWELLMEQPESFRSMLTSLQRLYEVTVVFFERPEIEQVWSSIKHLSRSGFAEDAAVKFTYLLEENRTAFRHFHEMRCPKVAIPFGGDSVSRFVSALARITTTDRLRGRLSRSPEFRKLADVIARPRNRVNAAIEHPKAVAFTFEFAHRLQRAPVTLTESRHFLEWFMWKVLQVAQPLPQWKMLPEENVMLERTIAANGQPGSLLTKEEAAAWRDLCAHETVTRFAEKGRCVETLALIRDADVMGITP